jgi:hypothetical protein
MPGDREQLGLPNGTVGIEDAQHVGQGLDVVHERRPSEQADCDGKRRLRPWLAPMTLDGVEQRGLLAADVGARATAELDGERPADVEHVVAQDAGLVRGVDRIGEPLPRLGILVTHVDVPALGADGPPCDHHRLDEPERIVLEQHAVLERAGLGLVGVGDDVLRPGRRRDRVPFPARGERGAAPADEPGVGDGPTRRARADLRRVRQRPSSAACDVVVDRRGASDADAREERARLGCLEHRRGQRLVAEGCRTFGVEHRGRRLAPAEAGRGDDRGVRAIGRRRASDGADDVDADPAHPAGPRHQRERPVERRHPEDLGPPQAEASRDLRQGRRREPALGIVGRVQRREEQVTPGVGDGRAPVGRGSEYRVEGVTKGVGERGRRHRRRS